MKDIFYWLLNMSITGTIAGFAVLLIRIVPGIPRRVVFALWLIPLIRFWFPALLVSKYSLIMLFAMPGSKAVPLPGNEDLLRVMNMAGAADSYFPVTFRLDLLNSIFVAASVVWLVFAVAALLYLALLYLSGIRIAGNAEPLQDGVYLSKQVDSPAVYGILRPRILVPAADRQFDLTWVIQHEKAHIRRLDNLWRLLALVTAAVHWFNPFIWLFVRCFLSDLEQACDESVLKNCTESEKNAYASALLDQYERHSIFASAFNGGGLRSRIGKIITYRRISVFSAVCMILLAIFLGYMLLTNPV